MITIRAYRSDDAAALLTVYHESVHKLARADYTEAQVRAWAPDDLDVENFAMQRARKPTYVAEANGAIAGFTDLEPDGHIDLFFVHPDQARIGVGSAMLRHVETEARRQHMPRMYAEVSITARPLFESFGFTVIAPQTVTIRGETLTNFRMEKVLN